MTLKQLEYIVTVAERGSMSEAAKELYISQPSLTRSIKELENEINLTVFERTNKGIIVSKEGETFLGYARQVLEQAELLKEKYLNKQRQRMELCISTQHYSFAVNAFIDLIREFGGSSYDFSLRETQTFEIIEDVASMKSEIGILYLSAFNEDIISKALKAKDLVFEPLLTVQPHIFISKSNPLASRAEVSIAELADYPYLSFEQGEHNSFYYSEEMFSTEVRKKNIRVRDRATLFSLLVGLNGYTVSSGIIDEELNGKSITAVALKEKSDMKIGIITRQSSHRSRMGEAYIKKLKDYLLLSNVG